MPYELLRAAYLRNSASHSHIMGPLPHFMRLNFFTLAWSNIKIMMPDELLRAAHSRNSASHSHTMGPLPHFMLMSGRVPKSDVPIRASTRGHGLFHPGIIIIKKI